MKASRTHPAGVRKEQRMAATEDPYRIEAKPGATRRCPGCQATYHRGRWTWNRAPDSAVTETCPACRRIAEGLPAGFVTLTGSFLQQHGDEVLALVKASEERAKREHPLQRIIAIEALPDRLVVTTTDPHLAGGIAHALHGAFKGDLQLKWSKAEPLLRATWTR